MKNTAKDIQDIHYLIEDKNLFNYPPEDLKEIFQHIEDVLQTLSTNNLELENKLLESKKQFLDFKQKITEDREYKNTIDFDIKFIIYHFVLLYKFKERILKHKYFTNEDIILNKRNTKRKLQIDINKYFSIMKKSMQEYILQNDLSKFSETYSKFIGSLLAYYDHFVILHLEQEFKKNE